MNVLILHSRYASGSNSGENRVVEDERRLLEPNHRVASWEPLYRTGLGGVRAAIDAIWSVSAAREAERLTHDCQPDVLHVHSLFPRLSPVVLRSDLPAVMTLHNFRLECLPATFLRDGRICEDCLGRVPWRGVTRGCYRGSRLGSLALATSLTLHRAINTFDRVDRFIVLSEFQRQKLGFAGLDPERMIVRRNFAWPAERRTGPGEYFLTLGRLSAEKGLDTVIGSWSSPLPLLVVGDGPERARLEAFARPGVEFRGAVDADEAARLLQQARALLYPSRCYEGSPRAVIEALAVGVPVIASDIGGLPEHVSHDVSGLLATADDADAWTEAVETLADDATSERLGQGAYESWRESFSPEVALTSLEQIYREAIEHAKDR